MAWRSDSCSCSVRTTGLGTSGAFTGAAVLATVLATPLLTAATAWVMLVYLPTLRAEPAGAQRLLLLAQRLRWPCDEAAAEICVLAVTFMLMNVSVTRLMGWVGVDRCETVKLLQHVYLKQAGLSQPYSWYTDDKHFPSYAVCSLIDIVR